jgi:hypothetical protein
LQENNEFFSGIRATYPTTSTLHPVPESRNFAGANVLHGAEAMRLPWGRLGSLARLGEVCYDFGSSLVVANFFEEDGMKKETKKKRYGKKKRRKQS